jgi:nitrate/nitrite-specific signal transduction histidine kinase
VRFAKAVGRGKFEKIDVKGSDEITEVADMMNRMCDGLSKTMISKNELERQVNIRTGELNEKIVEIETINKHMVDRELKMVELKNEIAALKAKYGVHEK